MNETMIVSVSPHIHGKDTTQTIMRDVLIALIPAVIASVLFFGIRALLVAGVFAVMHISEKGVFDIKRVRGRVF